MKSTVVGGHESNLRRHHDWDRVKRNQSASFGVHAGIDDIERAAIRDEGYDPDDPAVVAALDRVRAELASARLRAVRAVFTIFDMSTLANAYAPHHRRSRARHQTATWSKQEVWEQ